MINPIAVYRFERSIVCVSMYSARHLRVTLTLTAKSVAPKHDSQPAPIVHEHHTVAVTSSAAGKIQYRARHLLLPAKSFGGNEPRVVAGFSAGVSTSNQPGRELRWEHCVARFLSASLSLPQITGKTHIQVQAHSPESQTSPNSSWPAWQGAKPPPYPPRMPAWTLGDD